MLGCAQCDKRRPRRSQCYTLEHHLPLTMMQHWLTVQVQVLELALVQVLELVQEAAKRRSKLLCQQPWSCICQSVD